MHLCAFAQVASPGGIPEDHGGEVARDLAQLQATEVLVFCVWAAGPPRHYTYLEVWPEKKAMAGSNVLQSFLPSILE